MFQGKVSRYAYGKKRRHGQMIQIGNKHRIHGTAVKQRHGTITTKLHIRHVDIGGGIKQYKIAVVVTNAQTPKIPSTNDIR
jgi:hypothetical protein